MKKVNLIVSLLIVLFLLTDCAKKQYIIKSADGYLVEMNNRYDNNADLETISIVETFKNKLNDEMNEIIGEAAQTLTKSGTQSLLACFTADAMKEYISGTYGTADFAVINNGGHRTILNQGPITISNLFEIYVFENRMVLLELPGKAVKQLFDAFAQKTSMEGFSKDIKLVIRNKQVESLIIGGNPLNENATYKVVTVDYLAEGNDGMDALAQATGYIDLDITIRNMMIQHIRNLTAENKKIYATPDERIEIKE